MITVAGLEVWTDGGVQVLSGVDWAVGAGGVHAVVGESGSGKTTLALSLFGRVRPGLWHAGGVVSVEGVEPLRLRGAALRAHCRQTMAWLGQDPALALTPHLSVGSLLAEALPSGRAARVGSEEAIGALVDSVGLGGIPGLLGRRPGELSGGQRRRVAIARALASQPRILVLDEPTAGLDALAIEEVLATVAEARRQLGLTVVLVTHDLGVAQRVADEVSVMARGRIVESHPTQALISRPASRVARALVAAELSGEPTVPEARGTGPGADDQGAGGQGAGDQGAPAPALDVQGLGVTTPGGDPVVSGLELALRPGESVAIVGPSGVGKSTLVRALIGLNRPERGRIAVGGADVSADLSGRTPWERRAVQLIGQDPAGSLNPVLSVGRQLRRAVRRARPDLDRAGVLRSVADLVAAVRLDPACLEALPGTLSGGQAQRVAIARALALEPAVLLCDEATSSLDPTVQQAVLDLLARLRVERGLALIVITHDRRVARYCADRVLELDAGGGHRWHLLEATRANGDDRADYTPHDRPR